MPSWQTSKRVFLFALSPLIALTAQAANATCTTPVLDAPTTLEVNEVGTFTYSPGTTNVTWTFPDERVFIGSPTPISLPTVGVYTYTVTATNDCGTTSQQQSTLTIIPAMSGPAISINNGAASTTTAQVTLSLAATNAAQMYVTNDSTCTTGGQWQPYITTLPWLLAQESKTSSVYVMYSDAATTTSCLGASIEYDQTPPVVSFLSTPAAQTTTGDASFTFSAVDAVSGVATFRCALDQAPLAACPLTQSYSGLAIGPHTMSINATDNLGNTSATLSYTWSYALPPPPPVPSNPSITINNNATSTVMANVTLGLTATNAIDMYITNDQTCATGGTWEPFANTKFWVLTNESANTTVYATFRNDGGNTSCVSASIMFDMTAPTVNFVSVPDSISFQAAPTFAFSATDAVSGVANFLCALDTESLHTCALTRTLSGLAYGSHTMNIQAADKLGNVSAVKSYSWQFRNTPPSVQITTQPDLNSTSSDATFTFVVSASGATAVTDCSLDGAAATACTSPTNYSSLAAGIHHFSVQAYDSFGQSAGPATYSWTISITPPPPPPPPTSAPVAIIDAGPAALTTATTATFTFHGTSSSSTINHFNCQLDGATATTCTSPLTLASLSLEAHEFIVIAVDALGQPSLPAKYDWQVTGTHTPVSDVFTVDSSGKKIDIVIVDDNSPSMTEEQEKMAKRFSSLISHLNGLDWQIGIITTDAHEGHQDWKAGKLVPFKGLLDTHIINAFTPNVAKVFAETVRRKEWGSDDEEGIRALYKMLNRPENRPMIRQHSLVASIIVSDEDERSNGTHLRPENTPENLVATFAKKFGATNTYVNHSIIYHDGDSKSPKCPQVGDHSFGAHYAKLSDMTGGMIGDICANDYGDALKNIGEALQKDAFTVMLKCAPTNGKVDLTFSPQPPPGINFTLAGSKLSLTPYPPIGTKVTATYYCD